MAINSEKEVNMSNINYYNKSYFLDKGRAFTRSQKLSFSNQKSIRKYDIFLSHSFKDKSIIQGIYQELSNFGFVVYVDWIVEGEILDRIKVDKKTAETLKERMNNSKCLIFATSTNSLNSKWTPWELGYMDAKTGKCALLPIKESESDNFNGQEYFQLYPLIDKAKAKETKVDAIWVNELDTSKNLKSWIK